MRGTRNHDASTAAQQAKHDELKGDGADVPWESGILVRKCLRWESVRKLLSQVCNAVGDNHVGVGVYVHLDV